MSLETNPRKREAMRAIAAPGLIERLQDLEKIHNDKLKKTLKDFRDTLRASAVSLTALDLFPSVKVIKGTEETDVKLFEFHEEPGDLHDITHRFFLDPNGDIYDTYNSGTSRALHEFNIEKVSAERVTSPIKYSEQIALSQRALARVIEHVKDANLSNPEIERFIKSNATSS